MSLGSFSGSTVRILMSVVISFVTAIVAFMVPSKSCVAVSADTMKTTDAVKTDRSAKECLAETYLWIVELVDQVPSH